MEEGRVLVVGALYNGVDWASFLAETAENALSHVNVVLGGAARAVGPRLRLNRDREGWASRLAELASDAALFSSGIATQGVLTTEHRAERTLLPRVVDHMLSNCISKSAQSFSETLTSGSKAA